MKKILIIYYKLKKQFNNFDLGLGIGPNSQSPCILLISYKNLN